MFVLTIAEVVVIVAVTILQQSVVIDKDTDAESANDNTRLPSNVTEVQKILYCVTGIKPENVIVTLVVPAKPFTF